MSFQDVGRSSSSSNNYGNRRTTTTTTTSTAVHTAGGNFASAPASAPLPSNSWGVVGNPLSSSNSSNGSGMSQISDCLTQYQRNVGILEKIAHALINNTTTTTKSASSRTELETQYQAQSDVLRQLEQRLKEQIMAQRQRLASASDTSAQKQALQKLERDLERVQSSVQATKAKVSRHLKQYQQRNNNTNTGGGGYDPNYDSSSSNSANLLQQQHQQQQLLLQQDRLQEEIMREREEEIRKINQGMHTVNEIYKDLAHIVGSQQEQVDQIEDKMEEARNTAQSGLDQVHQANEKYGNSQCVIS
ncbi:hypothetical protein IV203_033553 [Nitzschia inconspicua]|uniref:t-SNARE coiled-coil homology domain-containing protein n=1 Tax=Nitzschia inconspicua TaxID=303405 RepID=A0A9K3PCN5_9STRA|nr:hypothetical protein IV203_023742 [Nitzschia inconspicua]KAG7372829.1 hypothetical protein IV203_033553 [Nitzschia inconspicua]